MSGAKSIVAVGYPPTNRRPNFAITKHLSVLRGEQRLKSFGGVGMLQKNDITRRRSFVVRNAVQPAGAPVPPNPPFGFLNWILGVVLTIILPLTSRKWSPLMKLKNEVDTAVETIEVIVDTVEKVAEGVEKAAEHIADDLPQDGGLRKAVVFVEHVAENISKDAHLVGDLIDKVQEAEEKMEAYVETLAEEVVDHHQHPKEEDRAPEQLKETNNEEHKQ